MKRRKIELPSLFEGYDLAATTRNKRISVRSKVVYQYSLDGRFIKEYPSTMEVYRQLGYHQSNISQCCNGNYKQAFGYIWCYKHEEPVIAVDKQECVVHAFANLKKVDKGGFSVDIVQDCLTGKRRKYKNLYWYYQCNFLKKVC
jgi:Glyceraldehyde-3-phosphate dehydrogenase/erythrose-4-phosphate dehydrogenase